MEINSFRKEEKIIMKKVNELLYNKYGDSINNYNKQNISYLIHSVNSKYFTTFKECILDNLDEYHKRYYNINECSIKLQQFFLYYLNYLTFFCRPVFHNFYYNNLLQYYNDIKADIFYQLNYKNKESTEDNKTEDEGTSKIEKHASKANLFDGNNNHARNKFEKINLLIFDPETRNKIDNSSDIMSSIDKINDNEEPNISYRQKLKINNNEYITLRNNDNLLDFIKEISFKNSKHKKNNNEINKNFNRTSLNSHSSSPIHKIIKRYISGDININNKLKKSCSQQKNKIITYIKNDKKNNSGKYSQYNIKEQESVNKLKNKTIKKLEIHFSNLKSNIYNLFKKGIKINKSNKNINIKHYQKKNSKININEKRLSFNNLKKSKPKIIESKKNSFINTSICFGNKISVNNNRSMKIKVMNTNNGINSNMQPINIKKSQLLHVYNNDRKNNKLIKNSQNPSCDFIQNGKNSRKNKSPFDSKFKNRNNNLLKTYLNNCNNLKKTSKNKSQLKEKTKTIYHSIDQMKTFSVRLIKSFSKKNRYHGKSLGSINNKNINTSNNISINNKSKIKDKKSIKNKKLIKNIKSNSNIIIKGKGELIYPKKNSIGNKNEVKLNVNLNLHSIFININSSTYNQHNNNKKIVLNSNLYENYNINGKSIKSKNSKRINNDSFKNKTESYKSRNKTQNKIKKPKYDNYKGINSFIFTNSNSHNKHNNKDEKDKLLKSNMHQNKNRKNKNDISIKDGSRFSTSIIKKSNTNFCRNNILDEKAQIYKIMAIKKK